MIDVLGLLEQAGVDRLREGRKEISGACPLHEKRTGKPDTHPSWSINRTTFVHHCFSCGYSGTLEGLLIDLTGAAPVDLEITLREQSVTRDWKTFVEKRQEGPAAVPVRRLTDFVLRNILRDVPNRFLERRRLRRAAIDDMEVRYDAETRQVVMPIRMPNGELLGAQYRQAGSVLTLPAGLPKSATLFGYTRVSQHDHVAVVESPLDAVRLYGLGIPAVASLGAWPSADQATLLARTFSAVYVALDDDKAGREGTTVLRKMLRSQGCATVPWIYDGLKDEDGERVKDVGDVADDDSLLRAWERTRSFGL